MPSPNRSALTSYQKPTSVSAKLSTPAAIIVTIPNTMWWTCTPPSLTTLPGHHGTRGLRIRRGGETDESKRSDESEEHQEEVLAAVLDQLVVPEVGDD